MTDGKMTLVSLQALSVCQKAWVNKVFQMRGLAWAPWVYQQK